MRDPAVPPQGEAKDFTWIATELARRTGLLEAYNAAINRGAHGVKLSGQNYDFSLDVGKVARRRDDLGRDVPRGERGDHRRRRDARPRLVPRARLPREAVPAPACGTSIRSWSSRACASSSPTRSGCSASARSSGGACTSKASHWWDKQLEEYEPLPHWRDLGGLWEDALAKHFKVRIADYPFWLVTARSMQYSWGSNVGIQLIKEVADNVTGHGSVVMNESAAEKLGIADGDLVEVRSPLNSTKGRVMLCEGIRPDTLLMIGQFDHWATPYAKDFDAPSMNALVPMLLDLTDATGSSADLVKVKVTRLGGAP